MKKRIYEENKAIEVIKVSPKYFHAYALKKLKTRVKIGPLEKDNGEPVNDPTMIADMLEKQYKSVFSVLVTEEGVRNLADFFKVNGMNKNCLNDIEFTSEDIIEASIELKPNSAAAPDNLPAVFLKKCKKAIATPVSIIWRKSVKEGTIPSALKEGLITHIFKGGLRGMVPNYRPLCLTSHIKVFERGIRKSIVKFLERTGQFNLGQLDTRDLKGVCTEAFKRRLDKFLTSLPDEPPIPHGLTSQGAASNSIIDSLQYPKFEQRCGSGGFPGWLW
ncbi:uncharacterized protein LOC143029837 [Oratosquilla oratoria]|uniref:uncharacterized protein LOC143029837 n=1 Tax=Oratosquilla oratoria TaxID=337810 RepID=UPI003F770F0A